MDFHSLSRTASYLKSTRVIPGASQVALDGKESACQCKRCRRCGFDPWVKKNPWRREWLPSPVFCLENHMDRGAWQATVPGFAESDITEQALRIIPVRMMVREESPREGSVEKQKGHHLAQKAESTSSLGFPHIQGRISCQTISLPWPDSYCFSSIFQILNWLLLRLPLPFFRAVYCLCLEGCWRGGAGGLGWHILCLEPACSKLASMFILTPRAF